MAAARWTTGAVAWTAVLDVLPAHLFFLRRFPSHPASSACSSGSLVLLAAAAFSQSLRPLLPLLLFSLAQRRVRGLVLLTRILQRTCGAERAFPSCHLWGCGHVRSSLCFHEPSANNRFLSSKSCTVAPRRFVSQGTTGSRRHFRRQHKCRCLKQTLFAPPPAGCTLIGPAPSFCLLINRGVVAPRRFLSLFHNQLLPVIFVRHLVV